MNLGCGFGAAGKGCAQRKGVALSVKRKTRRPFTRLVRLALLAVLVGIVVVTTAAAGPSACSHGASSVGPVVLINGQLANDKTNLTPYTEACLTTR